MRETMTAAVYRGRNEVTLERVPIPEIGPGEALVRVRACGVCGTDLKKIHLGLAPPPRIFGHETVGEIVALGTGREEWNIGERVALHHHVPCLLQSCRYCRHKDYAQCPVYKETGVTAGFAPAGGGFAQYVRVMGLCAERGMVRVPEGISDEEATFVEPLNTCLKAMQRLALHPGDTALIIGQGPIGLLFTLLCRRAGVRAIGADRLESRLKKAVQCGAERAVRPEEMAGAVKEMSGDGSGADAAILAVADASLVKQAHALVRPGGSVLLFAQTRLNDLFEADAGEIGMLEKRLIGSYSSDFLLQGQAAELIFSREIEVQSLISHRFPLSEIEQALAVAGSPAEGTLKVIVTP